jgi:serine phosphatase RsbU (regulator of sigma subunit)
MATNPESNRDPIDPMLRAEMDRVGLALDPSQRAAWERAVSSIERSMQQRDERIDALEELATGATGELARVRQALTRSYSDLGDILGVMADGVRVFQEASRSAGEGLEESLKLARHKFSLQLNATWFSHPIPEDTSDLVNAGSSLRNLHQRLRGLSKVLAELVEDSATAAATSKELELAGAVQKMLIPPDQMRTPGLVLHSWFQPVAHCGGDWWSAHALTDKDGLIVLGDVTGHGAPSAIITGAVKGACDLARMGMRGALKPSQLMRMLNRVIHESSKGEYMMTGVAIRVSAGGGTGGITNAGHRPPLRIQGGQVSVLQAVRDPPLGSTEAYPYAETEFQCAPGDLLVLYTDGIPETEDAGGNELGEKALRQICQEGASQGAAALRDRIRAAVLAHRGNRRQSDDICLVVAEID